jgi:hypothetical protein
MKILKLLLATAVVSLLELPLEALCQQPTAVGEILDKGGQKLTKEEIIKLVTQQQSPMDDRYAAVWQSRIPTKRLAR